MRKFILLAFAASSFLVTGCATVAGVGQDVQAFGRGVSHFANEVREEFSNRRHRTAKTQTRAPTSYPASRVTVRQPYTSDQTRPQIYTPTQYVEQADCDPYADELAGGALAPCRK